MIQSLKDILVVSDMDGTLLTESKELLSCNLETIKLFLSLGGHFTVGTGRMWDSVAKYTELTAMMDPAITCGGCVIYDFKEKKTLLSELLPRMVAHQVMEEMRQAYPRVAALVAGADNRFYQVAPSKAAQRLFDDENSTFYVRSSDDLPADWNKILFAGKSKVMEEVLPFLQGRSYPGVNFVATEKHYVEMMPEGVTKGTALMRLSGLLGIKRENTVVIGDYFNDIDAMKMAGTSVAMYNAPKEVRMIAGNVTGHCNDGGVGQYLYGLIRQYGG